MKEPKEMAQSWKKAVFCFFVSAFVDQFVSFFSFFSLSLLLFFFFFLFNLPGQSLIFVLGEKQYTIIAFLVPMVLGNYALDFYDT